MTITAKLRYLRIAPRKVRLVTDLIRGKTIEEAQTILNFTRKKAVLPLSKLLKQATANAKNNFQLEEGNLYISKILVDEGPKHKRLMPRARGKADEIQKKTSHITVVLDVVKKGLPATRKKVEKVKKPLPTVVKEKKAPKEEKPRVEKPRVERPKFKPEAERPKPKVKRGLRKFFRRKAF